MSDQLPTYIELEEQILALIKSNKKQELLMDKLGSKIENMQSDLIEKQNHIDMLELKLKNKDVETKKSLQDMKHFYYDNGIYSKPAFFEHEIHYIVCECIDQLTSDQSKIFNLYDVIQKNIENWTPDKILEIASKRDVFHTKYGEYKYQTYRTEKLVMNEKQLELHQRFLPQYYPFKLIPIDDDGNNIILNQ